MRSPFVSATGSVTQRDLLLVRIVDADGVPAFGESAPLPSYDGVTLSDVQAALEDCREVLSRGESLEREELLAECASLAVLPQAVAAIDLALWDLAGRRAGQPVARLLGAERPEDVSVNHAIAAPDRSRASGEALAAARSGFRSLKLKVGLGDDAGRIAAVRAATGPEMTLRLDANGAWTVEQASAALAALEPAGIELCEEPVSGLQQIAALAAITDVPLAIDETTSAPGALERRVCDAVCLKLGRAGGISGLVAAARLARAAGYDVYLGSTLDGPLGVAGALHAAAVIRPQRPSGLATLPLFADRPDPLPVTGGRIVVPRGAGLGDGLLDWYGVGA
jgi:L-alanine-DL-glutamate epimerase-like enolase superfamily enzyme